MTDDVFDGRFQWDSMCNGLVRWISGPNYKVCRDSEGVHSSAGGSKAKVCRD